MSASAWGTPGIFFSERDAGLCLKLGIKLSEIAVLSLLKIKRLRYLHLIKLNGFRLPSVIGHLCEFLIVSAHQLCSSLRHCFYKRNVISLSTSWPEFSKWSTIFLTDLEPPHRLALL